MTDLTDRLDEIAARAEQRLAENRLGKSMARETDLDLLVIRDLLREVHRLQAAVELVRALHVPDAVYAHADECGCGNEDHALIESVDGDYLCWDTPTGEARCCECLDEDGGIVYYPCPTVRALADALGVEP